MAQAEMGLQPASAPMLTRSSIACFRSKRGDHGTLAPGWQFMRYAGLDSDLDDIVGVRACVGGSVAAADGQVCHARGGQRWSHGMTSIGSQGPT